ncbi:MAG: hypothetical protein ABI776_00570 [Nocardioidaceae bacterium]
MTASADVLILVESLGVGDLLSGEMRASDFRLRCALLLDRETEIRELVETAAPKLAGLRHTSLRAVPRLDPATALRLQSAVDWHGWLLGSLLDVAEQVGLRSHDHGMGHPDATPSASVDPEFLSYVLMCHKCLLAAQSAHELLQGATSEAIGTAVGADKKAYAASTRKVGKDDAWRRSVLAMHLDGLADGIDDVVSSPSLLTRARRSTRRAMRRWSP